MSIVTIYCAGTAYDDASHDIIAWLNAHTTGVRGRDFFFYNGPGSDAMAKNVKPAVADTAFKTATYVAAGPMLGRAITQVIPRSVSIAAGETLLKYADQATGYSIPDTVARVIQDLTSLTALPTQINLAGWSRGAITCLAIAHALSTHAKLSKCFCNLFLFDPVPGRLNRWNWKTEYTTSSKNVDDIEVLLMENVSDWITLYAVVDPFANGTQSATNACGQVSLIPMPGVHSSAVEASAEYGESAALGAHLVSQFLLDHDSPISSDRVMQPVMVVETYAKLLQRAKYGFIGKVTDRTTAIPNAQRNSMFFVNTNHRDVFAEVFPTIATVLQSNFNVRAWSAGAATEVQRLRALAPTMATLIGDGLTTLVLSALWKCGTNERQDFKELLTALGYEWPVSADLGRPAANTTFAFPALTTKQLQIPVIAGRKTTASIPIIPRPPR